MNLLHLPGISFVMRNTKITMGKKHKFKFQLYEFC